MNLSEILRALSYLPDEEVAQIASTAKLEAWKRVAKKLPVRPGDRVKMRDPYKGMTHDDLVTGEVIGEKLLMQTGSSTYVIFTNNEGKSDTAIINVIDDVLAIERPHEPNPNDEGG